MLTSLAFIFLVGLSLAAICQILKLPRIIGMLITGILLGPYVLNVLDPSILSISSELRQIALIIILLKAGLSLNLADLKKVGRPAIMMACIPATFEILAYFLLAPYFLGITRLEAAVMGAVMGAVSPAVVVPRMVQLMDEKYGTAKSIPQMILAGASCDDIYVSRAVFHIFYYGTGRQRTFERFYQHSGFHYPGYCTWKCGWLSSFLVFRNCLCAQSYGAKQHESDRSNGRGFPAYVH